jgi:hypothetical protein
MCLSFGSDPRRDFLGTAAPGHTGSAAMKSGHMLVKNTGNADHLQRGIRANCSYVMTKACATVKE